MRTSTSGFDRAIRRYLRAGMTVLDAGAGRGVRYPYDYAKTLAGSSV
jgi:hypothetical protein